MHEAKGELRPLKIKVVVEWTFPSNGAERIYVALVNVGFCHLKCISHLYVDMDEMRK